MGFVGESTSYQEVKVGVRRLAGSLDEVGTGDSAKFGTNEDAGAFLVAGVGVALDVSALGTDEVAGPRFDAGKRDAVLLMRLLDAGGFEVLQDYGSEVLSFAVAEFRVGEVVNQFVVLVNPKHAVRRKALHGEGSRHAHLFVVRIGFVVKVFILGFGGDGGVNLFLAGDTQLPEIGEQRLGGQHSNHPGARAESPTPQAFSPNRTPPTTRRAAAPVPPHTAPR